MMSFLRAFHDITTNQCLLPQEQYQALLALGLRHYRMATGMLVSLDNGTCVTLAVAGDSQPHNLLNVPTTKIDALVERLYFIKEACSKSCQDFVHVASHFSHFKNSAVLLTPVFSGKAVTGLVVFTDPLNKHEFSSADLENMSLLGRWMGSLLLQQRQRHEFEHHLALVRQEVTRLQHRWFHPHVMFGELVESYRDQCRARAVTLDFISGIDESERIASDPDKLRQIICYLLDNALEYSERGQVTFIALLRKHSTGNNLLLSVEGTGQGASTDCQRNTLTPLLSNRQMKPASTNGLELATVKALINQMDGEADVYSRPDGGDNVDIVLPVELSETAVGDEQAQQLPGIAGPTPITILVVDDNEINQCVMEAVLARLGLTADKAYDGRAAVSMASKKAYDLIFMDGVMPEMDGVDATRHLFAQRLIAAHCIITAMTANTSDAHRNACERAGMNAFLAKPVDLTEVKDVIFSAMQSKLHARLHQAV